MKKSPQLQREFPIIRTAILSDFCLLMLLQCLHLLTVPMLKKMKFSEKRAKNNLLMIWIDVKKKNKKPPVCMVIYR